MDIFSKEMEAELIKLIDKRLKVMEIPNTLSKHRSVYIGIEKAMKELNKDIVDNTETLSTFEEEINELKEEAKRSVKGEDLRDLVGQTMLHLMPNFKLSISKEIKKHLVAIAEYVIKTFKEKD